MDENENTSSKPGSFLKSQLEEAEETLLQTFSLNTALDFAISKAKDSIEELKTIHALLEETGESSADRAFAVAGKYGRQASDYLSAVSEAGQAGYKNAGDIAGLSIAAQSAGDLSSELANRYIFETDKAYELGGSVLKLTELLDGCSAITDHNAISMTDLAESMSSAASTSASCGVGIAETTAALGTMIAATGQDGQKAAEALETILLHIRQISDEEAGIDAEGLANYEAACNALNVSLKETRNGMSYLRDPVNVLRELSAEYNRLNDSDVRKKNLLDSLGSVPAATQFDALLSQWDTYEQMLAQYAGGTGSMAAQAETAVSSWEGSLGRLNNTWTATVGSIADSDAIVTAINLLNNLLSTINKITGALGPFSSMGLFAGLFAGIKNVGKCRMSVRIS